MSVDKLSVASADRAADLVLNGIADRRGLSVLRIGDGEGVMLNWPDLADPWTEAYLTTHFGQRLTQPRIDALAEGLARAVRQAAVLGVRPDVHAADFPPAPAELGDREIVAWAQLNLALRPEECEQLDPDSARRLIQLGHWMAGFDWPGQALLASAWIHFDWLESGFLAQLATNQPNIGLVTGRPELAKAFEASGVDVTAYPVPLRHLRRDPEWSPHFPDRYDQLLEELEPAFPGQVFFVGAGICGKVYCDVIAGRGGIALDIGAVCDTWLGLSTRPRVARHRWGQDAVPQRLLLENQLRQARQQDREEGNHGR
ncbi:MAG: hypothetical protein V2I57_01910 [Xanthomonadales bacterium]|jgi:hypothetical protein|nr:hypothetical protein [Xanthomonadales bacterium]